MSDKRRAEIEAKRAKLAELRKVRADRQKAESERRASEVSSKQFASSRHTADRSSTATQQTTGTLVARRDVDDLVAALVGSVGRAGVDSGDLTPSSSIPGSPSLGQATGLPGQSLLTLSGRASRQSDGASSERVVPPVQSASSATDHVIDRYACSTFVVVISINRIAI